MRDLMKYVVVVLLARAGHRLECWSYGLDLRWGVNHWRTRRGGGA